MADEAVRAMDLDFKSLKLPSGAAISLPVRAKHLDDWTREFLAAHPKSTVLHLGRGLDTRVYRVDSPAGARWYDVDLPAVHRAARPGQSAGTIGVQPGLFPRRRGGVQAKLHAPPAISVQLRLRICP
jgi:hypothetical protein